MKKWIALLLISSQALAASTPYMELDLPVAGITTGPQWAQMLVDALTTIDSHNHTTDKGVKVPTDGLDINSDLQFNVNNIVYPRSVMFYPNSSLLTNSSDSTSVYVYNGDLYYNNSSGIAVQITSKNTIVGATGNISGLVSPAAVTYNDTTKTFVFTQISGITASIAAGSYSLFENVSGAKSITLKSPTSLLNSYNLILPTGLPSGKKILTLDNFGVMDKAYDFDNSTLEVFSDTIRIKDLGVTTAKLVDSSVITAKIADSAVTTVKIADQAVTQAKLAARSTGTSASAGNVLITTGSGPYTTSSTSPVTVTGMSGSLTTTGRPVHISIQASATGTGAPNVSYFNGAQYVYILRDGSIIGSYFISNSAGTPISLPSIVHIDAPTSGAHTYSVQSASLVAGSTGVNYLKLVAYEL